MFTCYGDLEVHVQKTYSSSIMVNRSTQGLHLLRLTCYRDLCSGLYDATVWSHTVSLWCSCLYLETYSSVGRVIETKVGSHDICEGSWERNTTVITICMQRFMQRSVHPSFGQTCCGWVLLVEILDQMFSINTKAKSCCFLVHLTVVGVSK